VVFEVLLGISETFLRVCSVPTLKNFPSARYYSAANVLCGDVGVFGNKAVSFNCVL
jgi:hypothetical protein